MAQNYRRQKIMEAESAVDAGDIRMAMVLLHSLPQRDQNIFVVKKLMQELIALDRVPPVIQHTPDKNYNPNEPITIQAMVQDDLDVTQVRLFYNRKGSKTFALGEMKLKEKGVYSFSIPLDYHKRKEVRYYFTAQDGNENERSLGSKKKPFKIKSKDKNISIPQIP